LGSRPRIEPERVPAAVPKSAQEEITLNVAELMALSRIPDDVRQYLRLNPGCDVGVTIWKDEAGVRHLVVGYSPDLCVPPAVMIGWWHRDLGYVLLPDGTLLGPRLRGR
jgi:hypothetical protein